MNRVFGHQKGADAVREVVRTSREIGIKWLTLYAFSEENWKRPSKEIKALMSLLKRFLKNELKEMQKNGIRLQAIGRIEKLPEDTRRVLYDTMEKTAANDDLFLTLALSYGGRQEIIDAVKAMGRDLKNQTLGIDDISQDTFSRYMYNADMPDPDLLIRSSGEFRISNFLLWQIAYTEIYITPSLWPEFGRQSLLDAVSAFQNRERRFGTTKEE